MPDPASYTDPFAALFTEIKKGLGFAHESTSFFAIVTAFTAGPPNTAVVQRIGAPNTEGPYRVATQIKSLAAGDRVMVYDVTGEGGFAIMFALPISSAETPYPPDPVIPPIPVVPPLGPYFIGPGGFGSVNGAPDRAGRGTGSNWLRMDGWAFDAASDEAVSADFWVPTVGRLWTPTIYLAVPTGNAGNIVINLDVASVGLGAQIDRAADVSLSSLVGAPGVAEALFSLTYAQQGLELSGNLVRFAVSRFASSVQDTYASDAWFLGLGLAWA